MSFTLILIIVTAAITISAWNRPELQYKLMMNPYSVVHKSQFYRLLSSGFVHGSWMHLGFNMFTFFFFGRLIEQLYSYMLGPNGPYYFLALYILGIIISDIPSIIKHRDHPNYNSLGASGGVSAVVFSSIMFLPLEKIYIMGIIGIPGFILGILYIIYSYYEGKRMADNVNHHAHLIGAIFGVVFSIYVQPTVLMSFFEQVMSYMSSF
ncbi:MAG: rhomboid family intramembrane serine protease [Cyclobacteriaceae bacterium]